jgi:hypothetical protein
VPESIATVCAGTIRGTFLDAYHSRKVTKLGEVIMQEFVSRFEFEEQLSLLRERLCVANGKLSLCLEDLAIHERALAILSLQLRQFHSVLLPLLSAEQRELLSGPLSVFAGASDLLSRPREEAGDADEWDARVRAAAALRSVILPASAPVVASVVSAVDVSLL